ncbi:substrate-binding domain-containing protein [Aurantimonas sp. C2-6-R+9]|uniref:substrate-binding domain-containing protein n=1 Tax=unclassified Aurantimonas TaxID=2638230 RepID=UPI002E172198|nr:MULTISPECIES: substrate-binding domain-containing protein [unclassified Aurantimonas]MEC5291850.1 substrate-binding domain-containing protein [Aurantimonas sp. C2-3-R2]MEC5322833.1 substrate-binding domain-containing protein [Aurantimonas sp. A3-2-R12]MEC5381997.1 substrate-binding domain-containing protein [Aurantimonas sp. C2-6-R+9]MEC5412934.1 substrate-binding domain-containing protein [Aurantimonas sp. C2-4-R8]
MKLFWSKSLLAGAVAASLLGAFGAAHAQEKVTIASSMPALEFPFFVHMQDALTKKAAEIGGIELIATDGQNKTTKQTGDVEAAIIRGVGGIIISPLDSVAMAPALQQAVDAGIPVVTIDRRVEGVPGILAHVGADNVIGGEAQGKLIMELFPDGARIVNLQGQPGSSPAIDRNKGLHNVLDPVSDKYEFVAEQTANFAREEGASVTEAILAGLDSPPDAIVAANDDMALGALQVTQERGLSVPILGFDALPEALASIRDGGLAATVEQFPGGQSSTALQAMVDYIRDDKKPESLILLQPIAITKDNLDKAERLGEIQ